MDENKMKKKYKILRTKVEELESKLTVIISFPAGTTVPKPMVEEFRQQLGFVLNFLSAEVASGPSNPRHLSRISARVHQFDDVFRRWSSGDFDSRNIDDEIRIHDDGASKCSSLNDDGEGENMAIVEYRHDEAPSLEEDFKDCLAAKIGECRTEKRGLFSRGWVKGLMLFVLVFVLICFVGFVILFLDCRFDYYYYYFYNNNYYYYSDRLGCENFLTPT